MTKTQVEVVKWHLGNGGHNGRLAGHALRLLNEAVELCVTAGASADEIGYRVAGEIAKAAARGEFDKPVTFEGVRKELVDVQFLGDVIAAHTGGTDLEAERTEKLSILHKRAWEADADGVLWRPGFTPKLVPRR